MKKIYTCPTKRWIDIWNGISMVRISYLKKDKEQIYCQLEAWLLGFTNFGL